MFIDKETTLMIYANLNETISRATLRSFDLYDAFLDVIKDTPEYTSITTNYPIPESAKDNDEDDYWSSDDCIENMSDLFDALDSYAPDGYYFGAHEGDGSDFGYWEIL